MLCSPGSRPIHQIHSLYIKYSTLLSMTLLFSLLFFFFTLHVIVKSKTPMTMATLLFYLFLWTFESLSTQSTHHLWCKWWTLQQIVSLLRHGWMSPLTYILAFRLTSLVLWLCKTHPLSDAACHTWTEALAFHSDIHMLLTVLLYLLSPRCHTCRPAGAVNTTVRSYLVHTTIGLIYCTNRPIYQKVFMNVLRQSYVLQILDIIGRR